MLQRSESIYHKPTVDTKLYRISNNLYVGSGAASRDAKSLKHEGITHIVNAASLTECCCYPEEMKYMAIALLDSDTQNLMKHLEETNHFIKSAIDAGGTVLIHCHEGVSRAPAICAAYLMKLLNIDSSSAIYRIKSVKADVNPIENFRKQLQLYAGEVLRPVGFEPTKKF